MLKQSVALVGNSAKGDCMKYLFTVFFVIVLFFCSNKEATANEFTAMPMNNREFSQVIFPWLNETVNLDGDFDYKNFTSGNYRIFIAFFDRNVDFDVFTEHEYSYPPEQFDIWENAIENNETEFPQWFFHSILRKRVTNNTTMVEGFMFSAYESVDMMLQRLLYISSANYNILIRVKGEMADFDSIISEVPEYFEPAWTGKGFQWKDRESTESFGRALINGNSMSKTATKWYSETEEMIESIIIR
jgi:hypothetical protein